MLLAIEEKGLIDAIMMWLKLSGFEAEREIDFQSEGLSADASDEDENDMKENDDDCLIIEDPRWK